MPRRVKPKFEVRSPEELEADQQEAFAAVPWKTIIDTLVGGPATKTEWRTGANGCKEPHEVPDYHTRIRAADSLTEHKGGKAKMRVEVNPKKNEATALDQILKKAESDPKLLKSLKSTVLALEKGMEDAKVAKARVVS